MISHPASRSRTCWCSSGMAAGSAYKSGCCGETVFREALAGEHDVAALVEARGEPPCATDAERTVALRTLHQRAPLVASHVGRASGSRPPNHATLDDLCQRARDTHDRIVIAPRVRTPSPLAERSTRAPSTWDARPVLAIHRHHATSLRPDRRRATRCECRVRWQRGPRTAPRAHVGRVHTGTRSASDSSKRSFRRHRTAPRSSS